MICYNDFVPDDSDIDKKFNANGMGVESLCFFLYSKNVDRHGKYSIFFKINW